MDDLDRLAFRVARTVRTTYPQLMEHGFTLSDLEERLAPFPEARREMAASGADGYEHTVLRLLAGERGYLQAEPALQEACRQALTMASPAVSIVRTWAGSTLSLRASAFARHTPVTAGHGTLDLMAGTTWTATVTAARNVAHGAAHHGNPAADTEATGEIPVHGHIDGASDGAGERAHEPRIPRCGCHYCGSTLPTGRTLTYCPYCGLDLTIRQCPACSSEVERDWRYCVTCGRQAEPHTADGL